MTEQTRAQVAAEQPAERDPRQLAYAAQRAALRAVVVPRYDARWERRKEGRDG